MPRTTATKTNDSSSEILSILRDLKTQIAIGQQCIPRPPTWDPVPDFWRFRYGPDPAPPFAHHQFPYLGALDARRLGSEIALSQVQGGVADPGPEILLDRRRLIQLRLRRLDMAKIDLQHQIDLITTEIDLLGQELKDMK